MPPMATTTPMSSSTAADSAARRFAVACGVLSQYVKAATPMPMPMPMPASGARVQQELGPALADGAQQLTIFYGGRVVVIDGCTPARAAELIRYAAAVAAPAPAPAPVDMPIARKASLQRFLSKRKDRGAAVAVAAAVVPPYGLLEEEAVEPPFPPAKKGKAGAASSWLALGSLGDMHAQ
ncbi:hypothetical protein BRADI_1g72610v3 [Brachypodium distachyon]|uniref:Protein TIFY n=2 Tax=Brachypodium distachyon TaxID=15368 RepID=I1H907_BRADI|nr:hypothetical protein BRADI_1g72610v3 [Brachypodium distachyon]